MQYLLVSLLSVFPLNYPFNKSIPLKYYFLLVVRNALISKGFKSRKFYAISI